MGAATDTGIVLGRAIRSAATAAVNLVLETNVVFNLIPPHVM